MRSVGRAKALQEGPWFVAAVLHDDARKPVLGDVWPRNRSLPQMEKKKKSEGENTIYLSS